MTITETPGALVKTWREAAKISQAGLADRLKMKRGAIAMIETGRRALASLEAVAIGAALDQDPKPLLALLDAPPQTRAPRARRPRRSAERSTRARRACS